MLARALLTALMVTSTIADHSSTTNGLSASFDIDILSQAKDVYFGKILDMLNAVSIPDFVSSDGKDYLEQNSLNIN